MQKAKYQITKEALHISKGNTKIGKTIYSFSTLPGNSNHMMYVGGELLTEIPGTCSKHCESCHNVCYAFNSGKLHHNVCIKAWGENTLLLRSGKIEQAINEYLAQKNKRKQVVKTFRINVSGEIESVKDLEMWDRLAAKWPDIKFGLYTKNYEALDEFMEKHGDTASNFAINISEWHGVAKNIIAKYKGKLNVFEYNDSNVKNNGLSEKEKERLSALPKCPAVTFSGHHAKTRDGKPITCDMCGRCYRKTGETTAVWAH